MFTICWKRPGEPFPNTSLTGDWRGSSKFCETPDTRRVELPTSRSKSASGTCHISIGYSAANTVQHQPTYAMRRSTDASAATTRKIADRSELPSWELVEPEQLKNHDFAGAVVFDLLRFAELEWSATFRTNVEDASSSLPSCPRSASLATRRPLAFSTRTE
jgi:hypothetical protein